jgi:hypothetical protein
LKKGIGVLVWLGKNKLNNEKNKRITWLPKNQKSGFSAAFKLCNPSS